MAENNYKPGDGLKTVLLAGIGAMATTAEKSQEILNKLVEKGEITVEQGKALNKELKHKAEEAKADAKAKAEAKKSSEDGGADSSEKEDNIVDTVASEVKEGAADALDTAEELAKKISALNAEELEKLKALLKDDENK